jgi:hypothetical protein
VGMPKAIPDLPEENEAGVLSQNDVLHSFVDRL